jgi:hypothetical protein
MAWVYKGLRVAICLTLPAANTGCGTPSLPPMGHPIPISRVVDRVQCEVQKAIEDLEDLKDKQEFSWVRNYVAKAVLTLQVNTDVAAGGSASLLGPFNAGTYVAGLSGGVTGAANRIATYGFTIDFLQANRTWCDDSKYDGYPPLQGELGMREWLNIVLRSHNENDPFSRPKSLSHRLDFTLDGSIKLGPAYTLTRSKADAGVGLHRKDFHTLDIAIEYLSADDRNAPGYEKVCVVNLPGPCYYKPATVQRDATTPYRFDFQPKSLARPDGSPRAPKPAVPPAGRPAPAGPPREIPQSVEQKLDRALQNLELRSIAPRF